MEKSFVIKRAGNNGFSGGEGVDAWRLLGEKYGFNIGVFLPMSRKCFHGFKTLDEANKKIERLREFIHNLITDNKERAWDYFSQCDYTRDEFEDVYGKNATKLIEASKSLKAVEFDYENYRL